MLWSPHYCFPIKSVTKWSLDVSERQQISRHVPWSSKSNLSCLLIWQSCFIPHIQIWIMYWFEEGHLGSFSNVYRWLHGSDFEVWMQMRYLTLKGAVFSHPSMNGFPVILIQMLHFPPPYFLLFRWITQKKKTRKEGKRKTCS